MFSTVDRGQNQRRCGTLGRADGSKQIGPLVALIAAASGTAAPLGPHIGQGALLTDPGLVLPPEFDGFAFGGIRDGVGDQVGEVFLCASSACLSCSGC